MIFVEGSKRSIEGALEVFGDFTSWSGLNISIEKSTVYMAGVSDIERGRILRDFPFAEGTLPVKYLGLPLMTKAMRKNDYLPLVEKIRSRINTWQSRFLSYAGRLQLIKSVFLSIVNFWAAVFRLPSQCIKEVESLCASFLWSGPSLKTAGAKVAWKDICKLKAEGGLGLRALKVVNVVYGLKIIWRMLTGDSLWGNWINSYLLKRKNFWEVKINSQGGSWLWRKVLKLRDIAKSFYCVDVGDGCSTSFWFDKWSTKGVMIEVLGDRGVTDMGIRKDATVCEAILSRRRTRRHRSQILNEVEEEISKVALNRRENVEDTYLWKRASGFKVKFSNKGDVEYLVRSSSSKGLVSRDLVSSGNSKIFVCSLASCIGEAFNHGQNS